jgi:hypothetical protein
VTAHLASPWLVTATGDAVFGRERIAWSDLLDEAG